MLKINKKLEYALMVLKYMGTEKMPGELTTVREICHRFSCPFNTMAKIMQMMNEGGILESLQGVKGGYRQIKALCEISFYDLFMLIEKKENTSICHKEEGPCDLFSTCNIITPLNRLNFQLGRYFAELNLRDVLLGELSRIKPKEVG